MVKLFNGWLHHKVQTLAMQNLITFENITINFNITMPSFKSISVTFIK